MAYRDQYTIPHLHLGKNHYTFGFLLSFTMKEIEERMEKGKKKENREVISDTAKYTSEIFNLGNEGLIKGM